jgi:hypothetical protein
MTPVQFPEANLQLGKDQPEYATLPVFLDKEDVQQPMTACFQLSAAEIAEINATGQLWYTQLTFGNPFQPVMLSTQKPF